MSYQHLLVAVDAGEHRAALIAKAQVVAKSFGARLSVLSAQPPMPIEALPPDVGMPFTMPGVIDPEVDKSLRNTAQEKLRLICAPLGIAAADVHVVLGTADTTIRDTAKEIGADLIVVGHIQRRGISSWFSHTDEQVVGKASCDVLTIVLDDTPSK